MKIRSLQARLQQECQQTGFDQEANPSETRHRARILIVDDELRVACSLQRCLEPHDSTIATTGRAALALCEKQEFDMLLCDLHLPDLHGVEVVHRLQRRHPGIEKRVVFMTGGVGSYEDDRAAIPERAICLEKPFDPIAIERLLGQILDDARCLDQPHPGAGGTSV